MIFAVDSENYQKDVSLRGFVTAVIFGAPMVAFTAYAKDWVGVSLVPLLVNASLYYVVYAANVLLLRKGWLLRPEGWPMRVAGCAAAVAFVGGFAAASTHDASLAWIGLLINGMAIGIAVRPTQAMLAVFLVPTLAIRIAFVPHATRMSFVVGIAVCLGAHAVYLRVSRLMMHERRVSAQAGAAAALSEERAHDTAGLRVAMSLHDGLSGSLVSLRRAIRTAANVDGVLPRAREWLLRLRAVTGRTFTTDDELVADAAKRIAASLGVQLSLDADVEPDGLPREERRDLMWILSELIANAAAHGGGAPLSISLRARGRDVRVHTLTKTHRPPVPPVRGRGTRNIELRVARHGGGVTFRDDGVDLTWTRALPLESVLWRATAEVLFVVAVASGLLLAVELRIGPIAVGGVVCVFLVTVVRDRFTRAGKADAELERARRGRLDAEDAELLILADEALEPAVRATERALAARSQPELVEASDDLGQRLKDLMWALEWSGDEADIRADLRGIARERGRAAPDTSPSAAASPRERYRLLAALR